MMHLLLLLSLLSMQLAICELACEKEPYFLVKPAPVTAVPNSTAVFYCSTYGELSGWTINGYDEDDDSVRKIGIDNVERSHNGSCIIEAILIIPVTHDLNNSNVACMVFGNGGPKESDCLLRVQGLLGCPPNLHITSHGSYHKLTWNPPFSLDITDVDPDISGYTICTNVSNHCLNTTDTVFQFPTFCVPVEFTVSANNIVGQGEKSMAVYQPPYHGTPTPTYPKMTSLVELESTISGSGDVLIEGITFKHQDEAKCYGLINLKMYSHNSDRYSASIGPLLPIMHENGLLHYNTAFQTLLNDTYNISIAGYTPAMFELDVQKVIVSTTPRSLSITCVFTVRSQVQECLVSLKLLDGGGKQDKTASRGTTVAGHLSSNTTVVFSFIESGYYQLLIYARKRNGEVNFNLACYHLLSEVNGSVADVNLTSNTSENSDKNATVFWSSTHKHTASILCIGALAGGTLLVIGIFAVAAAMLVRVWGKQANTTSGKEVEKHVYEEIGLPQEKLDAEPVYEEIVIADSVKKQIPTLQCPAYGVLFDHA